MAALREYESGIHTPVKFTAVRFRKNYRSFEIKWNQLNLKRANRSQNIQTIVSRNVLFVASPSSSTSQTNASAETDLARLRKRKKMLLLRLWAMMTSSQSCTRTLVTMSSSLWWPICPLVANFFSSRECLVPLICSSNHVFFSMLRWLSAYAYVSFLLPVSTSATLFCLLCLLFLLLPMPMSILSFLLFCLHHHPSS